MVPARTPGPIVSRLAGAVRDAMQNQALVQRMAAAGVEPTYKDTDGMAAHLRDQRTVFSEVIQRANIRID
jgi:tripartite-type tricarboxylate transporter receptor subunit TctC